MYILDQIKSYNEQEIMRNKLLDRIEDDGVSMKHISRASGIGYLSLLDFKYGRHALSVKNTQRLRKYFSECGM